MAGEKNEIKAIKFLGWYFLRVAIGDLDETKPLTWTKGFGIPTPPAEGTATLKSVDGVITWVADETTTPEAQQGGE